MVALFYKLSVVVFVLLTVMAVIWPVSAVLIPIAVFVFVMGVLDMKQTAHAIRRTSIVGNMRYFLELLRAGIQQYFVESKTLSERTVPVSSARWCTNARRVTSRRFPLALSATCTRRAMSGWSTPSCPSRCRMTSASELGGPDCAQPYSANILNISAMSYGALSPNAIRALNLGAKKGGFYHNTGEGGISPYHLEGGDLVWQIGTGYFGCRNANGSFLESASGSGPRTGSQDD